MTLVPCEVVPLWHEPDCCDTPYLCVARTGTVQRIPEPIRDAVEVAGRNGSAEFRRVAAWLVEERAEVVRP